MNERNVDALAEALCWLACGLSLRQLPVVAHGFKVHEAYRSEAARLAAHGVLAPSALTAQDSREILRLGDAVVPTGYEVGGGPVAELLERIAKGEPRSPQQER